MDAAILLWLDNWRSPPLDMAMRAVTWLGSLYVLVPAALMLAWRLPATSPGRRLFVPAALLGAAAMAHLLKWLTARPRPDVAPSLIPMPDDLSFPSAHTMQVTVFVAAGLIAWGWQQRLAAWLIGAVLILLVGFSRLYLQVHFPSDVIAGLLFGLLWIALLKQRLWRV